VGLDGAEAADDGSHGGDLSEETVARAVPGRPLRVYPAVVSTEADALAWARAGAPEGALVVADYQLSPRGRAGWPWEVRQDEALGFSLVLRPRLPPEREGWLYVVAVSGLADVLGAKAGDPGRPAAEPAEVTIRWPDEVLTASARAGAVAVQAQLGAGDADWAVVTVLVEEARAPRAPLLARIVDAIEQRYRSPTDEVLADYLPRCASLGRKLRARLVPLAPGGPQVTGLAVDCLADGALVLRDDRGRRVAVRPQHLGLLEEAL
jgi:BirA family biotin operon repressor/biotin-[acetyl-CoA-carboxylase] ligase